MKARKQKPPIDSLSQEPLFPGYPKYPASEDIYNQDTEMQDLDPEDIQAQKLTSKKADLADEGISQLGSDLDIPGSDLDDDMEKIGSEDEENNYYSLGGDNHNDLEEDKGD